MIDLILITIIIILLIIITLLYRRIKYICVVLDEILEGNLNQRIRFQNRFRVLNLLTNKINKLILTFQESNMKNIKNSEIRKKMISNISHDLRTPLTSMLGYMELIFYSKDLSDEKRNEYLKIIYNKGNSLYNLMEEFFQVSKLDSNDVKINIAKINVSEIIRQTVVSFFSEIQKLGREVKINLGDNDVYVFSDKKSISRILNNLINNSLKHAEGATELGVNLKCDNSNIYIEVYDNGIGIPESDIDSVFDRLYTVEKSRNTKLKNSGLGLTIVKNLVENLKGSITVSSVPLKKTSFKISFSKEKLRYM